MSSDRLVGAVAGIASVCIGAAGLANYLIAASHATAIEMAGLYWGLSGAFLTIILIGLYILKPVIYGVDTDEAGGAA